MIKEEISKFMALVPLMLRKLIRSNGPDETDITDDSGILFRWDGTEAAVSRHKQG